MKAWIIAGVSLGLFGHVACLPLLALCQTTQPGDEWILGNGISSALELAVIALLLKAPALLKLAYPVRV